MWYRSYRLLLVYANMNNVYYYVFVYTYAMYTYILRTRYNRKTLKLWIGKKFLILLSMEIRMECYYQGSALFVSVKTIARKYMGYAACIQFLVFLHLS